MRRGEIWLCTLEPVRGSEQGGVRPVIVVSHDGINQRTTIAIIVPVTSRTDKKPVPTHVAIPQAESGLNKDSIALGEQVRVVSQERLSRKLGQLSARLVSEVEKALKIAQGLP